MMLFVFGECSKDSSFVTFNILITTKKLINKKTTKKNLLMLLEYKK